MDLFQVGIIARFLKWLLRRERLDILAISGLIRITATDPLTGAVVEVVESHNIIPTVGKQAIGDALIDAAAQFDTGITYCAIGTDSTTPVLSDTALGTESARKAITTKTRSSNTLTFSTFFTAAECTYAIEEVGLFGTSTASASADSGVLFGHALLSYDNSGGAVDLTIDYLLRIGLVA